MKQGEMPCETFEEYVNALYIAVGDPTTNVVNVDSKYIGGHFLFPGEIVKK
jgi:hypothetical protein